MEAGRDGAGAEADRGAGADDGVALLVAPDGVAAGGSVALARGIAGVDGERADGGEHAAADAGDRRGCGAGGGLRVLDDGGERGDDHGVVDWIEGLVWARVGPAVR